MKKLLKSLLTVFLFVGILASCETTDPLIDEAQNYIILQNYDSAYAALDRAIEANPEEGTPHYYKAMAHSENAAKIDPPSERKPYYRDFRESIENARELFANQEEVPEEAEYVDDLILNAWGREHNKAIEYATDDSAMATVDEPLEYSAAHLENAIIVNPDSTLSYDVLSQVYYMNNDVDGAIEALTNSMELKNPPPAEDFDRLSAYYATTDQMRNTISTLKRGMEIYPDSIVLAQKIADAYMQSGERDSSIAVIEQLIEQEPDNAQYHLALGTQLLQATTNLADQISANFDEIFDLETEAGSADRIAELEEENEILQSEINELADYAERELLQVIELQPDSENAYNALGIIYQNKAAALFDLRNYTKDNIEAAEYDDQAKTALTQAMEYYENVVEINPDHRDAWQSLSRIYTTLDMREEAEEALDKAGN
ncbi:MAG: tetratricopeptide repeat protein [Balneolaceae bacterium]